MTPRATVLMPTFDHGETLRYALASALGQTVEDLEVFIVGDGVPGALRPFLEDLAGTDPRVRFFGNDKGPRHGEVHRARALEEASGRIVCYLADDDLWLPNHVEAMLALLDDADFGHCLPLRVDVDGCLAGWAVNLADEADRRLLLGGENRVPLSCSAHTLEAYRGLPWGWRTTPENLPTDLYMYQQFLAADGVRAVSGTRPTCLHFPSPQRPGWSTEERCAELDRWANQIGSEEWRLRELPTRALEVQARGWAGSDAAERRLREERDTLEVRLREATEVLREEKEQRRRAEGQVARLEAELKLRDQTLSWRLRGWLLSLPGLGALLRAVAEARARRAGR